MKIFEQLKQTDLILASQSPRRKSLLEAAGFNFRVWTIPSNENFPQNIEPTEISTYLAKQKAEPFKKVISSNSIVITADTIVEKNNLIFNKAKTESEAYNMLSQLRNSNHNVITGVCITSKNHQTCFYDITKVTFSELSREEINYYIKTYKPFDKAGAYGIQEWIGLIGVEKIEGSYFNVMGLPVSMLYKKLKIFLSST